MATEGALSRIPFRVQEELVIESMARWMRFIGIVTIINGFLLIFLALVFAAGLIMAPEPLTASLGKFGIFIENHRALLSVFVVVALAMAGLSIYAGSVLCRAADHFDKVARTDVADQTLVVAGLDYVKLYFQIIILTAIVALLVAFVAALVYVAMAAAQA